VRVVDNAVSPGVIPLATSPAVVNPTMMGWMVP
jgi:hypothetical protein